jgi:hypothetical protein
MPFTSPDPPPSWQASWFPLDEGRPEVLLRCVGPMTFQLMEPFFYRRPNARDEPANWYCVGPHRLNEDPRDSNNNTDLASVPPLFWWLFASYGAHTRAAIIHDQLYDAPNGDVDEANHVFRDALLESGVPFLRRWIMWVGVDAGGRWRAGGARKAGVILQFIASFSFVVGLALWALSSVWDWWPFSHLGPWVIAALVVVGLRWPIRLALGTLGIALVLPPLVPELVSRSASLGSSGSSTRS